MTPYPLVHLAAPHSQQVLVFVTFSQNLSVSVRIVV